MRNIRHKKIIVTGASSGIGAQLAREISKYGGMPILIARSHEKLANLRINILEEHQIDCSIYPVDLKCEADVETIVENILKEQGKVDALINNAGIGRFAGIQDVTLNDMDDMLSVNVRALMQMTRLLVQHFLDNHIHGHIVNVASQAGKMATPKSTVYAASKHAVIGFSDALRLELETMSIFVTTVNLGPVDTNFFDHADPSGTYRKNVRRYMLHPQKVAEKMVKNLFKKRREINMPWWMEAGSKLHKLAPHTMENILKKQFNKK